jgi:hypothetical protein
LKHDILACVETWDYLFIELIGYLEGFWFLSEDFFEDYIFAW